MARAIGQCTECSDGKDKELVAHNLCRAHYSKHRRDIDPSTVKSREHRYLDDQNKMLTYMLGIRKLVNRATRMGFAVQDADVIESIVNRYMAERVSEPESPRNVH